MKKQLCGEFKGHNYLDVINIFDSKEFYEVVSNIFCLKKYVALWKVSFFNPIPLEYQFQREGEGLLRSHCPSEWRSRVFNLKKSSRRKL